MMKQTLAFLSLIVALWSCNMRKEIKIPYQADPQLVEQARFYFEKNQPLLLQQNVPAKNIQTRDNRVNYWEYLGFKTFTPNWAKTEQITLTNGNRVLITPLYRNLKVDYGNLYYIRRLRIELDAEDLIVNANIIELITFKKSVAERKYPIIGNVFEEINTRTDAKIMMYDIGYNPISENTSWKGEAIANTTNLRDDNPIPPPTCYYLTAVAGCNDVQYLADISVDCDSGDDANTIYGVGNIVNNCPGGGSPYIPPYDPNNPVPISGGGSGDTGQDQPFSPSVLYYNGVNITLDYKDTLTGQTKNVDSTIIEAFKFVVDDTTFRRHIKRYLPPDTTRLTISFDMKAKGGKFKPETNSIVFNPNLLSKGFVIIEYVQILGHEGIHAMLAKPTPTMTTQMNTAKTNLVNFYSSLPASDPEQNMQPSDNMTQHETMGEYYVEDMVKILRAFDKGRLGKNGANITDDAYRALFLGNLILTEHPDINRKDLIVMFISRLDKLPQATKEAYGKQFDALRASYK